MERETVAALAYWDRTVYSHYILLKLYIMRLRKLLSQYICCTSILMLYMSGFPKLRFSSTHVKARCDSVYLLSQHWGTEREGS